MPGVIISFENTFFTIFTSFALHTIASRLALLAIFACLTTIFFMSSLKPISFNDLLFKDVRIVTPTNFVLPQTFFAAFNAFNPELM